jgi:5'-nucleotidase
MSDANRPLILLTNDDGIRSPGLWAAAEALSAVGYVTVAAPREQSTGMGRSMPTTSDGAIHEEQVSVGGKTWTVYAVGGTPAQARRTTASGSKSKRRIQRPARMTRKSGATG